MSKNLEQVYLANPITTVGNTDLYYTAVGGTTDGAITGASLKAAFNTSLAILTGSGSPSAVNGTQGQLYFDTSITPNDPWICCTTGTPGTWEAVAPVYNSNLVGGPFSVMLASGNGNQIKASTFTFSAATYGSTNDVIYVNGSNQLRPVGTAPTNGIMTRQSSTVQWQANNLPATLGGTGVSNLVGSTITLGGAVTFSGAFAFTGTLTNTTSITFPTSGTLVNSSVATLSSLASIGTITTGTWNATNIAANHGGTGVANAVGSTITLGGAFTTSGAFTTTLTVTGNTNVTLPTSGTLITGSSPTITTPNIVGVTNASNASAGSVGEVISSVISSGAPVSFTSATPKDLTSISLTAGDWDVYGNINFTGSGSVITIAQCWCSLTSATKPDSSLYNALDGLTATQTAGLSAPYFRVNVSSTTTVYISGQVNFASGTATGAGAIFARRVR